MIFWRFASVPRVRFLHVKCHCSSYSFRLLEGVHSGMCLKMLGLYDASGFGCDIEPKNGGISATLIRRDYKLIKRPREMQVPMAGMACPKMSSP